MTVATFVTYANAAAMNADLSQLDGTYAQLASEMAAGTTQTYKFDSTLLAWVPEFTPALCPSQPYFFGLLLGGSPPTFVTSVLAAGEVHLIEHGFCLADGMRDEEPIISAISAALSSLGGGKIIFDRPPSNGFYRVENPILLQSNVTYEGIGPASYVRNVTSHTGHNNQCACFHGNGIAQSNYPYYNTSDPTLQDLGHIHPGDHTVTCPYGTGSNFPIGSVVLIFSKDGECPPGTTVTSIPAPGTLVNFQPFFSRQYRVVGCATGTPGPPSTPDTLTLDFAIPVDVPQPVICRGKGAFFGGIDTELLDRVVIRNLRVSADDTTQGKFIDGGMYDSLIENIWIGMDPVGSPSTISAASIALLEANGLARTEVRGLRGFFSVKALELGTGSHDCHVHEIHGGYIYNSGAANPSYLVLAGEYTANIEYSDFHIYAPDAPSTVAVFNVTQITGLRVRDGYVRFAGDGIEVGDSVAVSTSDVEFRNVVLDLSAQNSNFNCANKMFPTPHYPTNIRLRNVRFIGDTPGTAAILFNQHCDVDFDDVDASTGVIEIASGVPPTGRMSRVKHLGWSGSFTDINQVDKRGMIRVSGQGAYSAAQYLFNVTTTSTTANNVVATYTLPPGLKVTPRDQFIIESSGNNGTGSSATNVAFYDGSAVVLTQAITAVAGAWTLRAVVTVEGDTAISTSVTITYPTGAGTFATSTAEARHTGLSILASGLTMKLEGWVVAGPTLTFNTISMYPKLYGE